MTEVFYGKQNRFQLRAFDFTDDPRVLIESKLAKGEPLVTYSIHALPNTAHKSTAFTTGVQLYYGDSFLEVLDILKQYLGNDFKIPRKWHKYFP